MKKPVLLLSLLMLVAGTTLMARSPDRILRKHFKVMGQQKLAQVNSMKTTGKMTSQGMEFSYAQFMERPSNYRVEGAHEQLTFLQVYNGQEGWNLSTFYDGSKDLQPFSEEERQSIGYTADLDGLLWDWKTKVYAISMVGKEKVENIYCYSIQLTTKQGDSFTYHIACDSFLLYCISQETQVNGKSSTTKILFSDYRKQDGINLAYQIETKIDDEVASVILVDKYEINPEFNQSLFSKPVN